MTAWVFLIGAIVLEIAGTFFLKMSEGFAKWQWGVASIGCYWVSFALLAPALKDLPVGVVYAFWAGFAILGAALIGYWVFAERLAVAQYGFIAMILVGAVGLRLTTTA